MDPLVSLHYYAPVCAAINLLVLPFTEGLQPFYAIAAGKISWAVLVSNASLAFLLNIAAVFLVGAGSGLVLTLAGVFKVSCDNACLHSHSFKCKFLTRIFYLSSALCFCSVCLSRHYKFLVRIQIVDSRVYLSDNEHQATLLRCPGLCCTRLAQENRQARSFFNRVRWSQKDSFLADSMLTWEHMLWS